MRGASLASLLLCVYMAWVGVPLAGHALWAEVGGGISIVTSGKFTGQHINLPANFNGVEVIQLVGSRLRWL